MILRMAYGLYRLAWALGLPLVLLYLWRRARKDPGYWQHIGERFGRYQRALPQGGVWLHAVSLGEIRSATGLIERLIARGTPVIVTTMTPAGRRETERLFSATIARGALGVVWVPFDMGWCLRRFLRAARPRIALPLEVEIWPAMIMACKRMEVPLYLCNAQYGSAPFARDSRAPLRLRQRLIGALDGAFVKSERQAERFRAVGLSNLHIVGELRFDQPIPAKLVAAGETLRARIAPTREIITIASGVAGEEALFRDMILNARKTLTPAPFFVYVPRAPERFELVAVALEAAGLRIARRSAVCDAALVTKADLTEFDLLLGDSLGEMYAYLAMADRVIVGAGFVPAGAHNIIEALALGKPVMTGPYTWTIEYPFEEAKAVGIAQSLPNGPALLAALARPTPVPEAAIEAFLSAHGGAAERHLAAIDHVLGTEIAPR